jgi:hypothetical protein
MTPVQSTLAFTRADQIPMTVTSRLEDGFKIDLKIQALLKEIDELTEQKQLIINEHINAGITSEGQFSILTKVKKTSRLDPDRFAEKYPAEFEMLWRELGATKFKPSQKEAAMVLTSFQIEKICNVSESVTHVIDWDPHQGAEP